MKIPRNLNGTDLAECLVRNWGYAVVHQTGSHIILRTESPTPQTVPVPAHKPLRIGTLNAILRQISVHKQVPREEILDSLR